MSKSAPIKKKQTSINIGIQPIDAMMSQWGLDNHQLVYGSSEQLTHKQVQRARKGRRLTLKMMQKVTRAFNITIWNMLNDEQKELYYEYMHRDLFNYAKGYDANWEDPNTKLQKLINKRATQ